MASTLILRQAAEAAARAKIKDQNCSLVTIELNADYASIAFMAIPAWTAFAVEMGLKTLLTSTKFDQNPLGHDLAKLLRKLPSEIQGEIESKTLEGIESSENTNFAILLEENRLVFEEWRYFHEGKSTQSNIGFLQSLMLAIHNVNISNKVNA